MAERLADSGEVDWHLGSSFSELPATASSIKKIVATTNRNVGSVSLGSHEPFLLDLDGFFIDVNELNIRAAKDALKGYLRNIR